MSAEVVNAIREASMDVIPEERGSGHPRNGNSPLGKAGGGSTELELVALPKPFGHQECEGMSPGVRSAPKALQRIIALILEGFQAAEIRMNAVFNLD